MPMYRGIPGKDMSARDWMNRFEGAARIAKLDTDERKIIEFRELMRDDALDCAMESRTSAMSRTSPSLR